MVYSFESDRSFVLQFTPECWKCQTGVRSQELCPILRHVCQGPKHLSRQLDQQCGVAEIGSPSGGPTHCATLPAFHVLEIPISSEVFSPLIS